ncbi:MAG TPA: NAD+ synthase [Burkholderiales bacterium]|nr:NAD+ synthase [Burkholderiales bacterium]
MTDLKISIFQFNPKVGGLSYNTEMLLSAISKAKSEGSNLFISSELAICGYLPEDLLLRPDFYKKCQLQLEHFFTIFGITMIIGCPYKDADNNHFNSAFIIRDGRIVGRYDKMLLPNYDVFDEKRYFISGTTPLVFDCCGVNIGVVICEDVWQPLPVKLAKEGGAELICAINSSPYTLKKYQLRLNVTKNRVIESNIPVIYVNQIGGQDNLVFDGASFILNKNAEIVMQMPAFEENLKNINFNKHILIDKAGTGLINHYPDEIDSLYKALVLATKDYVYKNGFKGVLLGLSGGIDSALTLAIAVDALGRDRVMAVMMPSIYTADISIHDSRQMVENIGVKYEEIEINSILEQFKNQLKPVFLGLEEDVTEENLQARIRGTLLMAISNKLGYLVLTTSNKSEAAVGYATLYGDMAGGFAPIKDVLKTQVYKLCKYRNNISSIIPERIILRKPTAELKFNQFDQDSLPEYEILDQIISCLVEKMLSVKDIIQLGFKAEEVNKVAILIKSSEYKRQQAAVGPKVSAMSFNKDWRYPITNDFKF